MDLVTLFVLVALAIEIALSMRAAWRIAHRYSIRAADSRVFRMLTRSVIQIAFVGGGIIGVLCLYSAGRAWWPDVVPAMDRGVFTVLLGAALGALVYVPIGIDREIGKVARSEDPRIEEAA